MTPHTLCDREEIRDLLARYNILGDRGRVVEMVEVFAPDGRLDAVGQVAHGREAIARLLSANRATAGHTVTRHHLGTQLIEVAGGDASVRTYFAVLTNAGLDHHGVYIDRLARIEGRWLIVHRDVRLDWQSPTSVYEPLPVHARASAEARAPDPLETHR